MSKQQQNNQNDNGQGAQQWNQLASIADYFLHFGLNPDLALEIKQQLLNQWEYQYALLLGCSGGEIQGIFQQADNAHWVGVDYAQLMLALSQKSNQIAADAAKLPLKNRSMDLIVVATGILDHINDQAVIKILAQCYQASKQDGQILLCYHHYSQTLLKQLWWLGAFKGKIIHQQQLNRCFVIASYMRKVLSKAATKFSLLDLGKDLELLCNERQLDFKQIISCLPSKHYVRSRKALQQLAKQAGWQLSPVDLESKALLVLSGYKTS
ncbi:class I SAM-dependent methyltransferase [Endozoicomonas sp. SM1973]|uniref:Class I SAM-dependent methyltransferase n=1 Tax=Spartinivicinus marinus TaxID=2994442 RepID=A0A853IE19_9GAMM|nr:class I SAM-dependent methyltransferase [Spartinivicinus marinus]MCX4029061.1 class I SAM-dependent methyltransferase [Spartinivicinus marinus]NYZ68788.1 class I SAM-dependent methyltransferase [Spartinivicinus marinus]